MFNRVEDTPQPRHYASQNTPGKILYEEPHLVYV